MLDLTETQKAQIKAVIADERPTLQPLFQVLKEDRHELRQAIQSGTFDETAIRALAEKQAKAQIEAIVARARLQSKIFALLTPDQQALAQKILPLLKGRHGGFRGL